MVVLRGQAEDQHGAALEGRRQLLPVRRRPLVVVRQQTPNRKFAALSTAPTAVAHVCIPRQSRCPRAGWRGWRQGTLIQHLVASVTVTKALRRQSAAETATSGAPATAMGLADGFSFL